MISRSRLQTILQSDFFLAFLLLVVFLLTNGYQYGWDDQHLEIPLLKSLIDHTLYQGDYYVESLQKNFVSYFYPLLARLITVDQVPAAYLILYLFSRYFLFFWMYKLWQLISGKKTDAFICVVMFIVMGRVQEFLYRTFSHQEFALAIIFAGIYYFYKERFVLASVILGIAANFHLLYSLFPMAYLGLYLLLNIRKYSWKLLLKSSLAFLLPASPVIIWAMLKRFGNPVTPEALAPEHWIPLYYIACPQNFLFDKIPLQHLFHDLRIFLSATQNYWVIIFLCLLNFLHNDQFKKDKKAHAIVLGAGAMFIISFIFSYIFPIRSIVDLNLIRNAQFLLFLLMGYTTTLVLKIVDNEKLLVAVFFSMLFALISLGEVVVGLAILFMTLLLFLKNNIKALLGGMGVFVFALFFTIRSLGLKFFSPVESLSFSALFLAGFLVMRSSKAANPVFRNKKILILIPLIVMTCHFLALHHLYNKAVKNGLGYWKIQNDWEDMQRYAKAHTPKNAMILIPNDMEMGGFRILSERKVLVCYRDCGIIGFDLNAALEWVQRLSDIRPFKVFLTPGENINSAVLTAIFKYKADYIVFMNYYSPPDNIEGFKKMYKNGSFSLFQIEALPKPSISPNL